MEPKPEMIKALAQGKEMLAAAEAKRALVNKEIAEAAQNAEYSLAPAWDAIAAARHFELDRRKAFVKDHREAEETLRQARAAAGEHHKAELDKHAALLASLRQRHDRISNV